MDAHECTLKNLKPKTDYVIKVQAVSERGPGVISQPYRVKTLPSGFLSSVYLAF